MLTQTVEIAGRNGQLLVHRYQIACTDTHVYTVLVPDVSPMSGYTTLYMLNDRHGFHGGYCSPPLPPELNAIPAWSAKRAEAVSAWRQHLEDEAYEYILHAFPRLRHLPHERVMGNVEYHGPNPA